MQTLAPVLGMIVGGSGATLLARILGTLGTPITPASITSIAYTVTDLSDGTQLGTGTFSPGTAILPALVQNDPRWSVDSANALGPDGAYGYNFAADVPSTSLPPVQATPGADTWTYPGPDTVSSGPVVQIDVAFTPVSGQPFRVSWRCRTWPVFG